MNQKMPIMSVLCCILVEHLKLECPARVEGKGLRTERGISTSDPSRFFLLCSPVSVSRAPWVGPEVLPGQAWGRAWGQAGSPAEAFHRVPRSHFLGSRAQA